MTTPYRSATTLPPIDDVMQMPFTTSPLPLPRPRLNSSSSPMPAYLTAHSRVAPTITHPVQTRIVGRNASSSSWADVACSPPAPARTRRTSAGAGTTVLRPVVRTNTTPSWPHLALAPQPFPRPTYLDHSALRGLLQTELPEQASSSFGLGVDEAKRGRAEQGAMIGNTPVFRLPTRWSEQDRHPYLSVSPDGRELSYNGYGIGSQSSDPGLARANHAVPPACGVYYYEVDILSKNAKAQISVGFTSSTNRLNKLPGWERDSWGYHGDDGYSYAAEKSGQPYGPTFGSGDTIGAGIDFTTSRAFFTKNGTLIGPVFDLTSSLAPSSGAHEAGEPILYPAVGLRHQQEGVRANFGGSPFRFDIEEHVQGVRDAVWAQIKSVPVAPARFTATPPLPPATPMDEDGDGSSPMPVVEEPKPISADQRAADTRSALGELVLGYLVHHGYAGAARALHEKLAREPDGGAPGVGGPDAPIMPSIAMDGTLEQRLAVLRAIQQGDIDSALVQAENHFPDALEAGCGRVRLALRCRKFVELVNGAAEVKKRVETRASVSPVAVDDADGMDVDGVGDEDDTAEAEAALKAAIAYGQGLRAEYKGDPRREVQAALDRAFGVVAYRFPSEAHGEVGRWAGQAGRDELVEEVNAAILESLGSPRQPGLERAFRLALATTTQLGLLGCGSAVFADVRSELLSG
ncbi:SPRY-domain-containing protein [Peniophora sp. CONT]|nr:SPRY-domain-containing protein [Peniophora sp. CONT]